ncbi:dienelactone hydrolase [Apodospora peruviana]|uniref:Dienelactone hydrolase n=1 Tax=Apodospora peruviana TaxID=516989 RepID=A0AAE0MF73_9PEZI|nr:dienelactone hydrolase [Apodospora peruviana]
MDVNGVANLVQAALPNESKNKNVAVLKDNWTGPMNHNDPGFLSDDFPRNPPKLYITAEFDEFDPQTLAQWRNEGFNVTYLPMGDGGEAYLRKLRFLHHKKDLGPCETFGIIAYGDAASLCLEQYHVLDNNAGMKLGCLIAYYPSRIPDPGTRFPSSVRVLVHLTVGDVGVVKHSQMVGIQGKKRVTKRNVDRGLGVGGTLQMGYPAYSYDAEPGFAEHDMDEYDPICAELAWSRSIATARRTFRVDSPSRVEVMVESNSHSKFLTRNVQQIMSTYTTHMPPHVTHVPTLTGGIDAEDLEDFYDQYFVNSNPESMDITLLSRTIGVDRVVDEMYVSFKHTQDMPWILPGVAPTNKRVEIMMVSIVTLRGGKLYHEHVYWDQASVLVQVGLLDPKLVPQTAQEKGVKRLPVVGRRAARRMFSGGSDDEDGAADNRLIAAWEDDAESEMEFKDKMEEGVKVNAGSEQKSKLAERPKRLGKDSEQNGTTEDGASESTESTDKLPSSESAKRTNGKKTKASKAATVEDVASPAG